MKKLSGIILITFIFSIGISAQSKAKLIGKVSQFTEDIEVTFHAIEATTNDFAKDPNALFAMRVCSSKPLPVAFGNAHYSGWVVRKLNLEFDFLRISQPGKFSKPSIFILRNDTGCQPKVESTVEFWFVPSDADFPPFVEIKNYDDINVDGLIYDFSKVDDKILSLSSYPSPEEFTSLTPELYEEAIGKILLKVKNDKTAFVIIETRKSNRKNKVSETEKKARDLKSFLNGIGVGNNRIFLENKGFENPEEDLYPNVSIVYQKL